MMKLANKDVLLDSGMQSCSSNGGWKREIIYLDGKGGKFRIFILSESYESQSYARLYKWTDKEGWENITSKNPKKEYGIDVSYRRPEQVGADVFKPMITDLVKLSEAF